MSFVPTVGVVHAVFWWLSGLLALGVDIWAGWSVWRAEEGRFRYGTWSRLGWLVVIFGTTWHLSVIALPVGALLARSKLWSPPGATSAIPMGGGGQPPEGWS